MTACDTCKWCRKFKSTHYCISGDGEVFDFLSGGMAKLWDAQVAIDTDYWLGCEDTYRRVTATVIPYAPPYPVCFEKNKGDCHDFKRDIGRFGVELG